MGIYDRQYYRQDGNQFARFTGWSVNTWIIVINIAVFIVNFLIFKPRPGFFKPLPTTALFDATYFSTFKILPDGGWEFWRFLTFQFQHADIMHIGFNMLGLYIFGGMVESYLGARKYLAFYLVCGIFGGLFYLLLNLGGYLLPNFPFVLISDKTTPLVGASAGVFGVIMACAYIAPNMQVQLLFPPIPMKLKTMAFLYVGIAVVTLFFNGRNAGGEAAHLGGAAAGFFFIRNSHLLRDFFDVFRDSRKTPKRSPRRSDPDRLAPKAADPSHDEEVDRILAKVKDRGVQSLTDREKRVLARDTEEKRARG